MLTTKQLFRKRLREEWAFQYRVWRMAVDWTVALYVVVPFLAFFVFQYITWWHHEPRWMKPVPVRLSVWILYVWCWFGAIRLFVQEADSIFLLQKFHWIKSLMAKGIVYSTVLQTFWTLLIAAIAAPLFIQSYSWTMTQEAGFALLLILLRLHLSYLKQWTEIQFGKWVRRLIRIGIFVLVGAFIGWLAISPASRFVAAAFIAVVLLAALLPLWIRYRLSPQGAFLLDVQREQREKLKVGALMLMQAGIEKPKPMTIGRRPIWFRRSNAIFKKRTSANILAEAMIKPFCRTGSRLRNYVQIVVYSCICIFFLPVWVKLLAGALLLAFLVYYVVGTVKETQQEPFIRLFRWDRTAWSEGTQRAVFVMLLPGFISVGLVGGMTSGGLVTGLMTAAVCTGIAYGAAGYIGMFYGVSKLTPVHDAYAGSDADREPSLDAESDSASNEK